MRRLHLNMRREVADPAKHDLQILFFNDGPERPRLVNVQSSYLWLSMVGYS